MEQISRKTLADGVRLTCVNTTKFKTAAMSVSLVLPLGGEDSAALAALPHILRRGTRLLPDLNALGKMFDDLYGMRVEAVVRKRGEAVVIGLVADVIDERFGGAGLTAKAASLLLSFFYDPLIVDRHFSPDYVAGEAENLADRIAARRNDPRSYATRRLWQEMCKNETFGRSELGEIEDARALTPESVHAAYLEALQSATIELFYCGGQKHEDVEAAFAAALGERSEGPRPMPLTTVYAKPLHGDIHTVTEEMDVTQGKLSLGFRTGITHVDDRYPALLLANAAFGGGVNSKLFLNVREKLSLCYYASSQIAKLKGVLAVNSGIDNANVDIAREEILKQLSDLQNGEITAEELEAARRTMLGQLRSMSDTPMALEGYWLDQSIAGLDGTIDDLRAQIETVTREQVIEAANAITLDTVYFLKGGANA